MELEEIWIVRGEVTSNDVYDDSTVKIGDTEWQFSDGPPGERGSSSDYVDLEKGLREHSGCIIHWYEGND